MNLIPNRPNAHAHPLDSKRREFVLASIGLIAAAGFSTPSGHARADTPVWPARRRNSAGTVDIRSVDQLTSTLKSAVGHIAIAGGAFSMGGQTFSDKGIRLGMRGMDSIIEFRASQRQIKVQSGATWRNIQSFIDPYGLAIRTMQSYSNFTVGGSIGVNCHGRYVGHGAIAESVEALTLCLANGELVECSRGRNAELFSAAIGGYGAVGVIVDATLRLDENAKMTRKYVKLPLDDYFEWFQSSVLSKKTSLMHNADLIPGEWRTARSTTWQTAPENAPLTTEARLQESRTNYFADRLMVNAVAGKESLAPLRAKAQDSIQSQPETVWRNFEASLDVQSLEPFSRHRTTFVLQEYFIPESRALQFARKLVALLERDSFGVANVSIRHAPADPTSLMSWARDPVFSFVLYLRIPSNESERAKHIVWERELIGIALANEGTYYLPYLLHARADQFSRAYLQSDRLKRLRKEVGAEQFTNRLLEKYL
jgi:FAD/FMN-containing dehydrogenase